LKLYYSRNLNPRVAVAVARYLGSHVEYVAASPRDPANTATFRAINPNALVPVLVDGERRLWEADAIACYLSRLAGSDFWRTGDDAPEMILWLSWAAYHFNNAGGALYFDRLIRPRFNLEPADPEFIAQSMRDFRAYAAVLDGELVKREWLLGDRLSYADFRVATPLPFAKDAGMPVDEFPNIARWNAQLMAIDAWREPFAGLD
jgi:glutathione S-transferase